ncbi:MAG: 6-bladed beta-propeller [Bryobacteraceae bacterium]|jgi:DNA-binding beta-propeller fold protein YncE
MVQFLLSSTRKTGHGRAAMGLALLLLAPGPVSARPHARAPVPADAPQLEMDGGRRLVFEGNFSSERDLRGKRGFWTKLKDAFAGEPEYRSLVRPYGVAADSRGRIIVTDPGSYGVHIFDFAQRKYKFLSHAAGENALRAPQCVAVDRQDRIYVTDSDAGKIFVFLGDGKLQRVIGELKGGEGIFKRPTGIAVDSEAQRIYVSDSWRNKIFVLDMQGSVVETIGKSGRGPGEFNMPTELRLDGPDLVVVDSMNFRVQVLDRSGAFRYELKSDGGADIFRPKGVAVDSEGHVYLADAFHNIVQVFDREDRLLYYFGKDAGIGDFQLPAGLFIDSSNRILLVDSYHRRVQMFHYFGPALAPSGAAQ